MRLNETASGTAHTVRLIHGSDSIAQRLMELGLIAGAAVKVLGRAPFGGPLRIRVGSGQLALRRDEARMVEVVAAG